MDFNELTKELQRIIKDITENPTNALSLFDTYCTKISSIPAFSENNVWSHPWRLQVYEFGRLFSDKKGANPTNYFLSLNSHNWESSEALAFIHSELIWNFWSQNSSFVKDEFSKLIVKYPGNPEFYNSYGHFQLQKENYEQALIQYKTAVRLDSTNTFVSSMFNGYAKFFSYLIEKNKLDEATKLLDELKELFKNDGVHGEYVIFMNIAVGMGERLADQKRINKKIQELNEVVEKRVEGLRSNLVNTVALFTSVIGYLLIGTNVVMSSRNIKDSFFLMYGLGLVLCIFVIIVRYQFKQRKWDEGFWGFLLNREFWSIVALIAVLLGSYKFL